MKLAQLPNCHLTYCTNIHPGESWQEVWSQFQKYLPAVKHCVSPNRNFGVGARLSAQAASELLQGDNLSKLKTWLTLSGMYIFTINGFPYGKFHHNNIKEKVYLPDWSTTSRLDYSKLLAKILAELLPVECTGTISTVPVGLRTNFLNKEKLNTARDNLLAMVAYLIKLHQKTRKHVRLAIEPEPGCYLETGDDIVSFFYDYLLTDDAMAKLRSWSSDSFLSSPELLLDYLGICLDTCHTFVMNETPKNLAILLKKNYIGIFKIQLSTALAAKEVDYDDLAVLLQLSDPIYLHQTVISNKAGRQNFFLDLPDALEQAVLGDNLRVHYHVPIFMEKIKKLDTSQNDLTEILEYLLLQPLCQHLEVETYTFDILPDEYRYNSVVNSISQELQWVLDILNK